MLQRLVSRVIDWVPEFLNSSCPVPTGRCEFLVAEAGPAQTLASP